VTPDAAKNAGKEKEGVTFPSPIFPSPEEQFNTAIASYSNSSNNGLGSPLFSWDGSASKLNDPSPRDLMGPSSSSSGLAAVTPSPGFVSGELKEWTPKLEQGQQLVDRRVTGSAFKSHSPLTALAAETLPVTEQRRDADKQLDEPIRSMRSLEESPSGYQGERVELNVGAELFDGGQSGGSDAEAARRARIESIFLLCGERRELARKTTETTSAKQSHESMAEGDVAAPGGRYYSPTESSYESQQFATDQSVSDFSTSPSFSDTQAAYYTDVSVSSLPSLMPAVSPQRFPSSRRPTRRMSPSIFANENFQPKQEAVGAEKTDVYVKWEKSGEPADGKLICIVNVSKSSTLSELREEVEAHIPVSKKNFNFLFLGVRNVSHMLLLDSS
jgi:hypothetical protein